MTVFSKHKSENQLVNRGIIYGGTFLRIFCAVLFLLPLCNLEAQTKTYATTLVGSTNTDNPANAHDSNLATAADVRAYSGVIVFESPYVGTIELQFPSTIPANTTSYVKITAEQANMLSGLAGGTLGSLLTVLTGQQEFTVDVKNGASTVVLTGATQTSGDFATAKLSIVVNGSGDYFIKMKPDLAYDRVKITNRYATLLGTGVTRKLSVFDAFYTTGTAPCGDASYTSFTATSVLSVAATGVTNPQNVLTPLTTDYSVINMGALAAIGSVEQNVFFDNPGDSSDTYDVKLSVPAATITAGVGSNLKITAYNGTTEVYSKTLQELLTLNLLTLTAGQITTIHMEPGGAVDRISVKLSSVVSVGQSLNFYSVTKNLGIPVVAAVSPVCSGSTASLTATSAVVGAQFKWYTSTAKTTLAATTNSGVAFMPVLSATTTYYVSKVIGTCESPLLAVTAVVVAKPSAGVIGGTQTACLTKLPAALTSASADTGAGISYRWEYSTDQVLWTAISPSNSTTYQPPVLTQATFYRRITIQTASGISCESVPTTAIKVSTRNCAVMTNPMIASRVKNGA